MSNFLNFAGNQGTTFKNHGTGGGTSFTLDVNATTNSVLLAVGGVLQEPGVDYTVSGTTITTTTSVTSGIEVFSWVLHKQGTAPVIQDNSVTGGKIALTSQAEGDIMYCNSSGDWVRLAKGTAGQLLAQNSGLTAPEWIDAGGGLVAISTSTFSGASTAEITSGIDGTYDIYIIEGLIDDFSADGKHTKMRWSDDNGSTYASANYRFAISGFNDSLAARQDSGAGGDHIKVTYNNDTDNAMQTWFRVTLLNPQQTGERKSCKIETVGYDNTTTNGFSYQNGGAVLTSGDPVTNTINGVQFFPDSGTFDGTLYLYGMSRPA